MILVGPNGAGKSTLIRLLAGHTKPDSGEVMVNPAVKIGYLDQEGGQSMSDDHTLYEAFRVGMEYPSSGAENCLFLLRLIPLHDFDKPVAGLSSGQRRKLQIARLIFDVRICCFLDEPTNDLSFDVLEALDEPCTNSPAP